MWARLRSPQRGGSTCVAPQVRNSPVLAQNTTAMPPPQPLLYWKTFFLEFFSLDNNFFPNVKLVSENTSIRQHQMGMPRPLWEATSQSPPAPVPRVWRALRSAHERTRAHRHRGGRLRRRQLRRLLPGCNGLGHQRGARWIGGLQGEEREAVGVVLGTRGVRRRRGVCGVGAGDGGRPQRVSVASPRSAPTARATHGLNGSQFSVPESVL